MAQKAKPQKQQQPAAKKGKKGPTPFFNTFAGQALMVFIAIAAIVFLPTTVILMVGMLPAIVALMVSLKGDVSRAYCVMATNFVGCFIFILDLWAGGHTFENSVNIITNPVSIIIMYSAACVGYFLDWSLSGMMTSVIQQRAKGRLVSIKERQLDLVEQWGPKVTGTILLDEDGFPIVRN